MTTKAYEAEYTSPKDLGAAIVEILSPNSKDKVYDPAAGKGGFILAAKKYIDRKENKNIGGENFCAREINKNVCFKAEALLKEQGLKKANFFNEDSLKDNIQEVDKFDVILSHPPFGLKVKNCEGELGIETNDGSNLFIQHIINSLKPNGRGAVIISNSFLSSLSKPAIAIRRYLIEECDLHAVLELPQKTFEGTSIGASVLIFKKGKKTSEIKYHLKALEEDYRSFIDFVKNDIVDERSYSFSTIDLDRKTYQLPTASSFVIEQEVSEKTKNFKDFRQYNINELCLEINLTRSSFEEKDNAAYLPKIGKSDCVTNLKVAKLKHQNYFQLVLDEDKILNGYFAYFVKSVLGQLIFERCFTGAVIPNITKTNLQNNFEVYAPNLEEQALIVSTFDELAEVKSLMEKTALELSSDPKAAKNILQKLHDTKDTFNELSTEEKILKLIKGGENLKVEFKETLSRNKHTGKKDADMQASVLKNLVGFMNKKGGQLLIGVCDHGEIIGIEQDFYKSNDDYKLKLSNLINDRIGAKESTYINYEIHTVKDKKICVIHCKKADEPAYFDDEFYIRTDPECRKLSSKEANAYIRQHFQQT